MDKKLNFKLWYEKKKKDKDWMEKHNNKSKTYYSKNKDKISKKRKDSGYDKKYYQIHKEKMLENRKKWYSIPENKIKAKASFNLYRKKHLKHFRDYSRKYRAEHREEINARRRLNYRLKKDGLYENKKNSIKR
jgi:hypothetical protein